MLALVIADDAEEVKPDQNYSYGDHDQPFLIVIIYTSVETGAMGISIR